MFSFFKRPVRLDDLLPAQGSDRVLSNYQDWHDTVAASLRVGGKAPAYMDWHNAKEVLRIGLTKEQVLSRPTATPQVLELLTSPTAMLYTSYNTDKRLYHMNLHLYEVVLKLNAAGCVVDYSCRWIEECRVDNVTIEGVLRKSGEQRGVWFIGNVFTAPLFDEAAAPLKALPLEVPMRAVADIRLVAPEEIESPHFPVTEESFRACNLRSVESLTKV